MSLAIVRRLSARRDLVDVFEYLGQSDPRNGDRFLDATERMLEMIAEFPEIGPLQENAPPELSGLRWISMKVFKNYFIYYFPDETTIDLIRILHKARDSRSILAQE